MKKISILSLAAVLFAAILTVGCQKEPKFNHAGDGYPVKSITFTAAFPFDETNISTKASDEVETTVENLAFVLISKASGATAKVFPINNFSLDSQPSTTNYLYTATVDVSSDPTILGGDYYLYAIANYDKKFVSVDIDGIEGKTKAQVDAMIATKGNSDRDIAESSLLMTGVYGTDGSVHLEGDNGSAGTDGANELTGTIHLKRLVAKISFNFTCKTGVTFVAESYGIYNYSRSETLFERTGWNGSDPASLSFAGNASAFSSTDGYGVHDNKFFFYMPENIQTSYPSTPATWTYASRDTRDYSAAEPSGPFTYAPAKATYVVVKGRYSDGTYSGQVTYTIHLGDFSNANTTHDKSGKGSYGNFSIRRNYKYNYHITINGVNSIVAECETYGEDSQPGADGNIVKAENAVVVNVDAHYCQVMIKFPVQEISEYSLLLNTPYSDGNIVDNNGTDTEVLAKAQQECDWVEFGAPASATEFAGYNPTKVVTLYNLLTELKAIQTSWTSAPTDAHYIISDGNVYITAYVNEYFYEGKALSTFVNKDNRVMTLSLKAIKLSKDEESTYMEGVVFSLTQKSIKSVEDLSSSNPFGIEAIEETTPPTERVADPGQGSSITNGWSNFKELLNGKITVGTSNWSDMVNVAGNGRLSDGTYGSMMQSTYDTGYYQCITRNRDEDGDGVIDEDEIKWYLPSVSQYCTLYLAEDILNTDERLFKESLACKFYFTSSYGVNGNTRIYFSQQGTAFSAYNTITTDNQSWWRYDAHTRCIRSLKEYDQPTSTLYNVDDKVFSVDGFDTKVLRTAYMEGEYPTHANRESPDKLPTKFEVAANDLVRTTETKIYSPTNVTYTGSTNYTTTSGLSNMFDGDNSTYWCSNQDQASGKYVLITLSEAVNVHSIYVRSNERGGNDYPTAKTEFQISADGNTWTTVGTGSYTLETNIELTEEQKAVNTKYVRLYNTGAAQDATVPGSKKWLEITRFVIGGIPVAHPDEVSVVTNTSETNSFTWDDVREKNANLCEKNYSQESDSSDLGQWRVPNEKEFYLMWRANNNGTTYFDSSINYISRSKFSTGGSVFSYSGDGKNLSTHTDYSTGHIRCVRDVVDAGGSTDARYSEGGIGAGL